jgi:hypothetical protein
LKAPVLKTGIGKNYRGFESLSLLLCVKEIHFCFCLDWSNKGTGPAR